MRPMPLVEVTSKQRAEEALRKITADNLVQPWGLAPKPSEKSRKYIREYMRKYRANKRRLTGKDR